MALDFKTTNLDLASSDIHYAYSGGLFRNDFNHLLDELGELQNCISLDNCYKRDVLPSFLNFLMHNLNESEFNRIFETHTEDLDDRSRRIQFVLPILSEALLQRNYHDRYCVSSFRDLLAFQSIVDSVYEVAINHMSTPTPPLVTWSRRHKGPFTLTAEKVCDLIHAPVGVVCLPPEFKSGGLLAWSVMGHEVIGHNFIHDKPNFIQELQAVIKRSFQKKFVRRLKNQKVKYDPSEVDLLGEYWCVRARVEEIASDIFGTLCSGPSLPIGCIGYFRGMSKSNTLKASGPIEARKKHLVLELEGIQQNAPIAISDLSSKVSFASLKGVLGKLSNGDEVKYELHKLPVDPHPIALLRPFAMLEALGCSNLDRQRTQDWKDYIDKELDKDCNQTSSIDIFRVDTSVVPPQSMPIPISVNVARISAEVVANIIATTKFSSIGDMKITEILNWGMKDEDIVELAGHCLTHDKDVDHTATANHIIAAAVIESCKRGADIDKIFRAMKKSLFDVKMSSKANFTLSST